MIITCPACATQYDLPEGAVGAEGRTVRCANCRESWFEPGGDIASLPATPDGTPPVTGTASESGSGPELGQADAGDPVFDKAAPDNAHPSPPAPLAPPVFDRLPLLAPTIVPVAQAAIAPPAASPGPAAGTSATEYHTNAYNGPAGGYEASSSVAHEPPIVPRRRRFRAWLIALAALALLLAAAAAALAWIGAPDWLPFGHRTFATAKPGLVLDFPRERLERRTLADGTEFFGARGTITNTGAGRQAVPRLLIVLRDRQQREVYRWEVVPPKRQLGPGETMTINEAVTDVPRTATEPEIGWAAG